MSHLDPAARRRTVKIAVLGPEGAGVRTTVAALRPAGGETADPSRPLLAGTGAVVDIAEGDGASLQLLVHAAPGGAAAAVTRRRVLAGASGVLVVLDAQRALAETQRAWLASLPALLRDASLDPAQVPVVLHYNKADLPAALRLDRSACDAAFNPDGRPAVETAAVFGTGVRDGLEALRRALRSVLAVLLCLVGIWSGGATPLDAQPMPAEAPPALRAWSAGRLVVFAGPAEARLAQALLAAAAARPAFPGLPALRDTAWIWVAPDEATFRRWVGPTAPEWGAAIAFPGRRVIVMQGRDAGGDAGDPVQTVRHELAHLALAEVLGPGVPRWFDEGYASFAAGEWGRDEVLATSVGLVWRGVPTLAGLDSAFRGGSERAQRAYALAHRAVAELSALGGETGVTRLVDAWRSSGSFDAALRAAHGMTVEGFEARFRSQVRRQYGILALATDLGLLTIVIGVVVGPFWWRRRRDAQARLERMRAFEARQDAAERASALARLLGEGDAGHPTPSGGA